MAFNQLVLLKVPTIVLGVIIISSAVIISIAGLLIVRRHIPHHRLKTHNDVAGPIFATVGVIYAVLLAFVVVIVWQNFDRSRSNVQDEANCLVDLAMDAEAFSPEFKKDIRALLYQYAEIVVNEEWPAMAKGGAGPHMRGITEKMWRAYSAYEPETEAQKAFFTESIKKLNDLGELRRSRLLDAQTGVHPILWFVLILGGLVTISFTFFFGAENLKAQLTMAILLAILISLILFTILAMDFPFTGEVSISPDPFKQTMACW